MAFCDVIDSLEYARNLVFTAIAKQKKVRISALFYLNLSTRKCIFHIKVQMSQVFDAVENL
jgi:hypothetical protein